MSARDDKQIPPLTQLYCYLTQGCNLRCRHCYLAPVYEPGVPRLPLLDFSLFVHVVEQALPLGLAYVKLSGGEPLMHPRIEEFIQAVNDFDLQISMETNGLLCSESIVSQIAPCRDAFISVSLDGADAQTHDWVRGVEGSFAQAVKAVRMLSEAGIDTQVIMSVMEHNVQQVQDMVELAETQGANSVKFNIVQPAERGEKVHNDGKTLSIEEHIALARTINEELAPHTELDLLYDIPAAFAPLSSIFKSEIGPDCGVCGIDRVLGLLPSGKYALCGAAEQLPALVFGDAAVDALREIWEDNSVLEEIRGGLPARLEGVCGKCLMKGGCRAKCIAQNYYQTHRLWAPFWFCQSAHEQGLFPESRLIPDGS
jgi:SynChlorMet cassette radical SAM/SPASM protein ScmF